MLRAQGRQDARNFPRRRHLPALDGLRGTAVLLVVAYHTMADTQSSHRLVHAMGVGFSAGWSGVSLFFVLSGFLITGILWDNRDTSHWRRNFYARRILRIFPRKPADGALVPSECPYS